MLELRKGGRLAWAILLEESSAGVKGIVECSAPGCRAAKVLFCAHPDQEACIEKHGEEMHKWLLEHDCVSVPN